MTKKQIGVLREMLRRETELLPLYHRAVFRRAKRQQVDALKAAIKELEDNNATKRT